jgi:hypothetical protein
MTTRFNARSKVVRGVPGLSSGYVADPADCKDFIASVGIEDVDVALFDLFDKEIPLQVSTSNKNVKEQTKIPVIFAAAEKWALSKRQKAIRDKNGTLVLPLLTVVRTSIQQNVSEDINGRGINQQTGELVIKKKLSKQDRAYQNLVNKQALKNQANVAVTSLTPVDGQLTTKSNTGDLVNDAMVSDGALLASNNLNNAYEFIVVPAPQFFTATYEVTLWTQYTMQMVQALELLVSSFLPQGNAWKLDTPKGYWFVATVSDGNFSIDTNVEDMSQDERIIKNKFTVKVPGYIFASTTPGAPVAIRKYVSAPSISFDVSEQQDVLSDDSVLEPFLGSDDPTLPLNARKTNRKDQRLDGRTSLDPRGHVIDERELSRDPGYDKTRRGQAPAVFKKVLVTDSKGNVSERFVRVKTVNKFTGESIVSSGFDLGEMITSFSRD